MGEQAELDERPRVEQQIDALARGELVLGVLLLDAVRAAHRERARPALAQRGGQLVEPGRLLSVGHRRPEPVGIPRMVVRRRRR